MRKLRLPALGAALVTLAIGAATASADPTVGPQICPGAETPVAGSYRNLTVTGNEYVASGTTLNVRGNLRLARGACLDAFTMGTVTVGGNVLVGNGAILALGCTLASVPPDEGATPCTGTTEDTVGRNIVANQPLTMYLDGDSIRGNVISLGGGDPSLGNPALSFPIKDNSIGGNVVVHGWKGAWFGVIRDTVGGNVIVAGNVGTRTSEPPQDPTHLDSNEVQSNTISRNLICVNNTPPAQVNPTDGGQPNHVGGHALGECAGLTG